MPCFIASELSVNNETKNSAPKKIIIPAQIIKDDPKKRAFLYSSLNLSKFFAPKFCHPIDRTAVFKPITGSKKTCSIRKAAP